MGGGETENTILAALKFAEYAYKRDSPFVGTVMFEISDNATNVIIVKSVYVPGGGVDIQTFDGRPPSDITVNCTVKVEKMVLLAILTGALEASVAFMWGQLFVDNLALMTEFTKAFDFSHAKFVEFQQSLNFDDLEEDGADIPTSSSQSQPQSQSSSSQSSSQSPTEGEAANQIVVRTPDHAVTVPTKKPLKQALAIKSLDLLQTLHGIGKEIDAFMVKVKEKEKVKKAFEELDEKAQEFQATAMYKQIQSNAVYVTLRTELERGASAIGHKAKSVGMDVVGKLATIAYPQPNSNNNTDNTNHNDSNNNNNDNNHNNNENSPAATTTVSVGEGSVSIAETSSVVPLSKAEMAAAKKEEKRRQLQEKLGKLQDYNKELGEQRKQRLSMVGSGAKGVVAK